MIPALLHQIEVRMAELRLSMAVGNASSWEAYQRMVGEYQGLQSVLDMLNEMLREKDRDD